MIRYYLIRQATGVSSVLSDSTSRYSGNLSNCALAKEQTGRIFTPSFRASVTANATTGKVTKTEKTDVLAANKGVLLENLTNADITLSLPVSAEAGGNETNDMIAFTGGSEKLSQTSKEDNNNYTHYILANESAGVGFYKVYSEGNSMGTNTAYLKVLTSVDAARSFLWFDESTGINAVEKAKIDGEAYNLAGQRVTNPTKGLYIVNGKKVIKN